MSIFVSRKIPCPYCRVEHDLEIADSLHISNHPRFRDELLAGTFQRFTCTACAKVVLVDNPIVYTDFKRKHWIYMFPETWEAQWKDFENEPQEAFDKYMLGAYSSPFAREMADGFIIRTVFGLPALAEKVLCLLHGIDDRWLEVLKLNLMQQEKGLLFNPNYRLRLTAFDAEKQELILYVKLPSGPETIVVPLQLLTDFQNANSDVLETPFQDTIWVDAGRMLIPSK